MRSYLKFISLYFLFFPTPLYAISAGLASENLSFWWILPFCGMLGSLALMPLLATHFWETHYGKVAFAWSLITILSLMAFFGISLTQLEVLGTLFHHYLPFVIMIGALYTISGGIQIEVEAEATPTVNTVLLALGALLAGWIGTTGASMLLIRPMLHVNRNRKNRVHQMIFFIFLVANIGGALTPLGDPPLFLGFLNGVSFFWPTQNLILPMIFMFLPLLILFYSIDRYWVFKEGVIFKRVQPQVMVKGKLNGFFFLGVIIFVLLSGLWHPAYSFSVGGIHLELQNVIRDGGLVLLALISWIFTPAEIHKANRFSWEPLKEVAKLFFGIFITVIPVIAILDAGLQGAMAPLISLVDVGGQPQNMMYFWLSGLLSSFLDNAPTYLVFFNMAGGDASLLMSTLSKTLVAISLGSVFMGAMTYIGNTPNFMVKSIAESHNISMPSFFVYMLWSLGILFPLFFFLSWWLF